MGNNNYICMSDEIKIRQVVFYKNYFSDFFNSLGDKIQRKIIWTLLLIEQQKIVPEVYLKHLEGADGLYEIRVQTGSDIYRIFCFFDTGKLIVAVNGFQKKTQKTPPKEIKRALKIKAEYYENK